MTMTVLAAGFFIASLVMVRLRERTIRELGHEPMTRRPLRQLRAVAVVFGFIFLVSAAFWLTGNS